MANNKQGPNLNLGRRVRNTANRPFHLMFLERVYDGAPRWFSKEWERHHDTPSGNNGDRLEREPSVKKLMALAHDWKRLFNSKIPYLITCTNLSCPLRTWATVDFRVAKLGYVKTVDDFQIGKSLLPAERNALMTQIAEGLARASRGKDLDEKCPSCHNHKVLFGFTLIRKKWVYIFKGSDGPLQPHTEIYIETPDSGVMYREFRKGAFNPDRKQPFPGYFPLEEIDNEAWQFFLSPVRLGPKALSLLTQERKIFWDSHSKVHEAEPSTFDVGVNPAEQPWFTVVDRFFTPQQAKTPYELIPLVDPFAWVGQIADLDYLPIIAARQQLIQDPGEQAKAFIAATLSPEKGKEQNEHGPEKESDPWSLKEETVEPPAEFTSSGNIAKAWVDRYKQALQYLDRETNNACCRVFFPIRFSLAHRVVEVACQENTTDPKFLAFGLTHWAHVLREMLVCEAGKSFVVWLARHKEAADRIPQRNVLKVPQQSGTLASSIGQGLPAQVLAYLSPVLIRGSKNTEAEIRGYLGEIEIEVPMEWMKAILAPDTVKPLADIALEIPEKYIHHYIEKFPEEIEVHQFHALNGASSWKARIQGVTRLKNLLRVFALLRAVAEFAEEYKGPDTGWGHLTHRIEQIETPVKIAEFLTEQSTLLVEEGLLGNLDEVQEKIAKRMAQRIFLGPYANKLLKASNTLRALRVLGVAEKILAGPVGLAMGGFELVIQSHESFEALEAGDLNAATAHHIKAFAGALVALVAGAESLALVGALVGSETLMGIGELAWLGPVGWIAAAAMLIGEIFLAYGKKTDFELYAAHCFLGQDAGMGGEEPTKYPWMGGLGWGQLSEPENGRIALLRLVSGFSVWIGWYPLQQEGPWWQIKANFIPAGAYFEVEVDFWNLHDKSVKVTQKVKIFPQGEGKLQMDDANGCDVRARHYPDATVIAVKITPRSLFTDEQKWDNVRFEWGVRVRLLFDGVHTLPVKKWVENEHGTISSVTNTSGE